MHSISIEITLIFLFCLFSAPHPFATNVQSPYKSTPSKKYDKLEITNKENERTSRTPKGRPSGFTYTKRDAYTIY